MKQILLINQTRLIVLRWHKNQFCGMTEFESGQKGYADFEKTVKQELLKPVKILIDIAEESIQIEEVPHLMGRNRFEMLQRIKNRYLQQYTYCHTSVQGRSGKEQNKDNILVSAITNSASVQPWIEMLTENSVPIIGIYSVPLVGERLLRTIGIQQENVLLILPRLSGGVRQSLYIKGKLKFSRASTLVSSKEWPKLLFEEVDRTILYLEGEKVIDSTNGIHVYVIASSDKCSELECIQKSNKNTQYHIVNSRKTFKYSLDPDVDPRFDGYLALTCTVLRNRLIRPHYLVRTNTNILYNYCATRIVWITTVLVFFVLGLWTIQLSYNGLQIGLTFQSTHLKIVSYKNLSIEKESSIPNVEVSINTMKSAVDLVDRVRRNSDLSPLQSMALISACLSRYPRIEPVEFQWINGEYATNYDNSGRLVKKYKEAGSGLKSYLMLDAIVKQQKGDMGSSIEEVKHFAETLSEMVNTEVRITKLPFDVDSNSRMVGNSIGGIQKRDEAGFSLVLYKLMEQSL